MDKKTTQQILNELPFNHSWKVLSWKKSWDKLLAKFEREPEIDEVQEEMLNVLVVNN